MHLIGRTTKRVVPWAVWLVATAAAIWIHRQTAGTGQAAGTAEVREFTVSALETGRLASVDMAAGQRVERGQVVARLETGALEREVAVAEEGVREAQAKIPAEERTLYLSGLQTERGFDAELDDARAERLAAESALEKDRAELASVRKELVRQQDLVARRLVGNARLNELTVRRETLEGAVAAWPAHIEGLAAKEQAARQRLAGWRAGSAGATGNDARRQQLRPFELAVSKQTEYVELLKKRAAAYVLVAPASGRVGKVLVQAGAVVRPGDAIATLVEDPRGVVAYVDEDLGYRPAAGERVAVRARDGQGDEVEGTVSTVAGIVAQIPARFWPSANRPRWGREVYIRLDSAKTLDPGQAVDITFQGGRPAGFRWSRVLAKGAAKPEPGKVRPLTVPAALAARSRFEPSGAAWVAAQRRYLLVSDDTGHKKAADNAPWLFGLHEDGAVDAEPVAVRGVEAVNDLEAITAAPDGTLYAIASQSRNQAGKRRAPRTVFLRMQPEGSALRATGAVPFYEKLASAVTRDSRMLAALGLGDAGQGREPAFEIEGLSWREGALLIGLKEPLDEQGRSLIWMLEKPERLFEGGSLSDAGLRLWGRIPLKVGGEPAGISEILALEPGALYVAGTNARGGAVFRAVRTANGDLRAELFAAYPGLKPEGMCAAPGGGRIVVVFDRDGEPPYWTQLELPE